MDLNYFILMIFVLGMTGTVSSINKRVKNIEKLLEDKEKKIVINYNE